MFLVQSLKQISPYVYIAGMLGATAAYVFYTPSTKSKRSKSTSKSYPRGLINHNNECFINVILQSLSASSKVHDWLQQCSKQSPNSTSLINILANIAQKINRSDNCTGDSDYANEFYAAHQLRCALNTHNWHIRSEENDCHELFHLLMDVIDEEQMECRKSMKSLNFFNYNTNFVNMAKPTNPFHGYLASQLQCLDCNYKYPLKLESFYSLSLNLPQHKFNRSNLQGGFSAGFTLVECINNYFKVDYISEMKCEKCNKGECCDGAAKTAPRNGFVKRQAIAKLPECLCLQIQRNSWSDTENAMIKHMNYVQFPLQIKIDNNSNSNADNTHLRKESDNLSYLSQFNSFSLRQVGIGGLIGGNRGSSSTTSLMNERIDNAQQQSENVTNNLHLDHYDLKAAIVHHGTAQSGHFIAYRKALNRSLNSFNGDSPWLQISDSYVKPCKEFNLLESNVYMLFYDRVSK